MFCAGLVLHRFTRINCKSILRHHKRFTKRKQALSDPGIRHRKEFASNEEEAQELADDDFDLESDFMHVGGSDIQHEYEMKHKKQQERFFIVKQKYFKEKFPNFLTWSDKEQIRYLHTTNPEEWSIDKLADGFPALPHIIKKVATTHWTKKSDSAIHSHDESVQQNWKLFKEGKLSDLPGELIEHLKNFGDRSTNYKPFKTPETKEVSKHKSMLAPNIKIGNEFSNIITSYEKLKNRRKADELLPEKNHLVGKPPKQDTFMPKTNLHAPHITLDKLREKIEIKAQNKKISEDEQLMLKAFVPKPDKENGRIIQTNNLVRKENNVVKYSNKDTTVTIVKEKKDYSYLEYPESINIPKALSKPGYTYKLNDCYYDDDGEFLYRVPGMDQ